jgi:competence protein ComEC
MMLCCYLLIFSGTLYLIKRTPRKFIFFLIVVLLIQSLYFFEERKAIEKESFIVFHKSRFSIIGKRKGLEIKIQQHIDTLKPGKINMIKSYVTAEYIQYIENVNFKNFIQFKEKNILIVDSLGVYQLNKLAHPIVILQYSPKINLERLIHRLKPSLIIADGSNYKSYASNWEDISIKYKVPFHNTRKKGAFKLEY